MRINITLAEYEHEPEGTIVVVNTNLPDGSTHDEVTAVFNRALSALYGYQIGGTYFDKTHSDS